MSIRENMEAHSSFHQGTRSSIRRIDPSVLQEELSDVLVPDGSHFPSDYRVVSEPSELSFNESRQYSASFSDRSAMGKDGNFDPSELYFLLEEELSKYMEHSKLQHEMTTTEQQQKREHMEETWNQCRRWLWSHNTPEKRLMAARFRGQAGGTALHLICRLRNPPHDLVQALVEADSETVAWVDSHGWLPLHHACASGVNPDIMRLLITSYTPGLLSQDKLERTPLHFFVTRSSDNPSVMAENARLLCATGAAELADKVCAFHESSEYKAFLCIANPILL